MNIVYMGTPEFARRCLDVLVTSRHSVLAVVTGPDKQAGRGRQLISTPVKKAALSHGLNVLTPRSLKDALLPGQLAEFKADLFVVVAFRILPKGLFSVPQLGSINIHGSLLPKYRGAAPINWALINGETETGLSSFFLKPEVDTGDVILQEGVEIADDDTFDSLYSRMADSSGPFLLRTLDLIERGGVGAIPQDDRLASSAPKLTPDNSMLDWGFPAVHVRNFVRGLCSHPGAYTYFRGKRLKVLACAVTQSSDPSIRPGTVIDTRRRLAVQCADSAVELTRVVPEGKKEMDGLSFINGARLLPGEVLGELVLGGKEHE